MTVGSSLPPQHPGWRPLALAFGSTGAVLALVRPVASHALALSVAFSGVSGSQAILQLFSRPTGVVVPPVFLFSQVTFRSFRSSTLFLLKVHSRKNSDSKRNKHNNFLIVALLQAPSIDPLDVRWGLNHWTTRSRD